MSQKRAGVIIVASVFLLVVLVTACSDFTEQDALKPNETLTPTALVYLPVITKQTKIIYTSHNLSGHSVAAECNPGGETQCPCSDADVSINSFEEHGEVTSNVQAVHTFVNAIGYKKFVETFPGNSPIVLGVYTYTGQFSLPLLPAPDINQQENPEGIHVMIQLWDGRNALYQSNKTTLEGAIYWKLNPWESDNGQIQVYSKPLILTDTEIVLTPDTAWHTFELVVDLDKQRYVSIAIDDASQDLSHIELAQRHHPDWGDEVSLSITTESMAAWPQKDCRYVFTWTTRFKDLVLGYSQ